MGHTDVVNVDPTKWTLPPFSAKRDGGYVYGRGTVDDKDNLTAGLMTMLLLKRDLVPLDRDVIFLAEAGEEGTTWLGIEYMVNEHFDAIDAEYCLAEGGGVTRMGGKVQYATVETLEKIPHGIELVAHGPSGHGSVPLQTNAIVHLARAVAAVADVAAARRAQRDDAHLLRRVSPKSRRPSPRSTTATCCARDPKVVASADDWLRENEPRTRRCCARRSRRTSFRAAIAPT